jgi:pimeloyl-ACP methyl ester carboxylesterase
MIVFSDITKECMDNRKVLIVCFMFFNISFLAEAMDAKEHNELSPISNTEFVTLKENPLAERLTGLIGQVGQLTIDGLSQYALLLKPEQGMPLAGWPVIIFNHGFHPEPFMNGRRSIDGISDRPGDYYRQIPQSLAHHGFLVVVPDYRGHNDSAGAEFTLKETSTHWYARDVLGVVKALESINNIDKNHLFMLGHSMGGQVTLSVAGLLGDKLGGASIWSTQLPTKTDSRDTGLIRIVSQLELINSPLNIHHAKGDQTTLFSGSVTIANQLTQLSKQNNLYSYASDSHLFTDDNLRLAIDRDVTFFRHIMAFNNRGRQSPP